MAQHAPDLDEDRTQIVPRTPAADEDVGSVLIGRGRSRFAPMADAKPSFPAEPAAAEPTATAPAALTGPERAADEHKPRLRVESPADGVRRLVLAEPARRNPLSDETLAALQTALEAAARDDAVRVLIIAADGPAFSGGHDLKEMAAHRGDPDGGRAYFGDLMARCARLMRLIPVLPKPVIAEVQGIATAAGCQLVAACDLAVASTTARFATNGIDVGLFCSTPMVPLSRTVARKHALQLLLTGDFIDAQTALQWGLVNQVVPPELLSAATMALATKLAAKSPTAIRHGKPAFAAQIGMGLDEAYRFAGEVMVDNLMTEDCTEGMEAFTAKRRPTWTGR